jgi:hypothetical protein
MKSRILLLSVLLFGATMFHPTSAKADIIGDLLGGLFGNNNNNNNNNNQGTNLPINGNAVYLMIAGLSIGIITVRKAKKAQATVRG